MSNINRIQSSINQRSLNLYLKKKRSYMLFDKSQISIVFSLTQKNIVADLGDQIASKNALQFDDEQIKHE